MEVLDKKFFKKKITKIIKKKAIEKIIVNDCSNNFYTTKDIKKQLNLIKNQVFDFLKIYGDEEKENFLWKNAPEEFQKEKDKYEKMLLFFK